MAATYPVDDLNGMHARPRDERAAFVREALTIWLDEVDGGSVDEIGRTEAHAILRLRPANAANAQSVRLALEHDQIRHRLGFSPGDVEQHEDEIFVRVPWPEED